MARYFEDLETGDVYELDGRYEFDADEIREFAEQYDPQPFHLDEKAAEESIFGGLAASGWHTAAASEPKMESAAASSSTWNGCGSYCSANSLTSASVTS